MDCRVKPLLPEHNIETFENDSFQNFKPYTEPIICWLCFTVLHKCGHTKLGILAFINPWGLKGLQQQTLCYL